MPLLLKNLPHTRGDEPSGSAVTKSGTKNLPHTRGDEPFYDGRTNRAANDLPHTRGDEPRIYFIYF